MNDFTFTETKQQADEIPFFEEAKAAFAPYYSSGKTIAQAQREIISEMSKLHASVLQFQEGYFGQAPKRHGYQIRFVYLGMPGVIRVAGLPIKGNETESKIRRVRVQALLNVRDWIKASITQPVFSPGSHPLMMKLLAPGTNTTLEEALVQSGRLALPAASDVIDGEFSSSL